MMFSSKSRRERISYALRLTCVVDQAYPGDENIEELYRVLHGLLVPLKKK